MSFDSVLNFRDAGGHDTTDGRRVRTGVLYRSGHLGAATDADVAALDDLDIRLVVDLRRPNDIAFEGENRIPLRTRVVTVPIGDFDKQAGVDVRTLLSSGDVDRITEAFPPGHARATMLRAARANVLDDTHRDRYSTAVRAIAGAPEGAVLVNCSAGKDRTGWTIAIVLLAVGVPERVVIDEYLRSNEALAHRMAALDHLAAAGLDPTLLTPILGVDEDYLVTALAVAAEHWGGIEGYLTDGLGIDAADRERLRARLLEGGR
jgi:protein-tyrosine phosphatase